MKMSVTPGRTEIEQSSADVLGLPILGGIVLVAIVVSLSRSESGRHVGLCRGAVLDVWLAFHLLQRDRATFVVTADDIAFSRGPDSRSTHVIQRTPDSKLSFRLQSNGFVGGQSQFLLNLRDDATSSDAGLDVLVSVADGVHSGSGGSSKVTWIRSNPLCRWAFAYSR
ncbi:MAG TPA: hypothetical protein VGK78_06995 [Nocardioides sp.]|uniref:hypothetical protein n=1 Tax=Nocardioides sp. TaxID=35761 RepID=UPI002F4202D6